MQSLFITATGTNVGKTHIALKLIDAIAQQGLKPGVYKPIETGVTKKALDAASLLIACQHTNPAFAKLTIADITAYTFSLSASPFCADTKHTINPQYLIDKHNMLLKKCDILLIEGAGGLMVPIAKEYMMINLIRDLKAKALLVTPSHLGCINDTLLSMMALHNFDINFDWCVNLYKDKEIFKEVTQPYYDAIFPNWWSAERGLSSYLEHFLNI
ncbi:MAG: dethiobiotin synthase [Sulfurovum sp.]|nr:dethiobiotin synthase [Sulfurovum sp.]MCB4744416.1 dethiobiotin synthase [Sulfurovum sp.]MCB4745876.1 dethiobiotin synthase [Sulfurovum sp.]MCB4747570.1 dethiobiotin synthase [Sulfurovum sp.]MCB4748943.1 dethiobiotin synthase [Sulfurovum sp.]